MIWTKDRRIGRFSVTMEMVKEEPAAVAEAFADLRVVPIVAEPSMLLDGIDYRAWSPRFDQVGEHRDVPWYDLEVTKADDGAVSYEFVKRKPRG